MQRLNPMARGKAQPPPVLFSEEDSELEDGERLEITMVPLDGDGELFAIDRRDEMVDRYITGRNPDGSQGTPLPFPVPANGRKVKLSRRLFHNAAVIEAQQVRPADETPEKWQPYSFEEICLFSKVAPTAFTSLVIFSAGFRRPKKAAGADGSVPCSLPADASDSIPSTSTTTTESSSPSCTA